MEGREGFPEDVRKRKRWPHVQEGTAVRQTPVRQLGNHEAHLRAGRCDGAEAGQCQRHRPDRGGYTKVWVLVRSAWRLLGTIRGGTFKDNSEGDSDSRQDISPV